MGGGKSTFFYVLGGGRKEETEGESDMKVSYSCPITNTSCLSDTLHFSFDVTAKGQLPLLLEEDSPSLINNITVFLYSYDTGRNFTISNGTAGRDDASIGDLMHQEPGSNVKHVNWIWPDCLVGDGEPENNVASDRGMYNVSLSHGCPEHSLETQKSEEWKKYVRHG